MIKSQGLTPWGHELAHLKRGDVVTNWIGAVLLLVHWFNPLVWLAVVRMRTDCELAADELALSFVGENENQSYGETILGILKRATQAPPFPGLVGVVETNKPIKRRIHMIAKFKKTTQSSYLALGIVAVTGVSLLTASSGSERGGNEGTTTQGKREKMTFKWKVVDSETGSAISSRNRKVLFKNRDALPERELHRMMRHTRTKSEDNVTTVELLKKDANHLKFEITSPGYKPTVVDLGKLHPEPGTVPTIELSRNPDAPKEYRRQIALFAYSLKKEVSSLQSLLGLNSWKSWSSGRLHRVYKKVKKFEDDMRGVLDKIEETGVEDRSNFVPLSEIVSQEIGRLRMLLRDSPSHPSPDAKDVAVEANALLKGLEALVPEVMALARNGDGAASERSDGGTAPDRTGTPSDSKPSGVFPGKAPPETEPEQ